MFTILCSTVVINICTNWTIPLAFIIIRICLIFCQCGLKNINVCIYNAAANFFLWCWLQFHFINILGVFVWIGELEI